MKNNFVRMTKDDIQIALNNGYEQCVVEAKNTGTICWDDSDSKEREPIYEVKIGDLFWCWNFKETPNGYTHDYSNMGPTDVLIKTNVSLELVYVTESCEDPNLFNTELDKSPNWT